MTLDELKSKIYEDHITCLSNDSDSIDKILAKSEVFSKLIFILDKAPLHLSPGLINKTLVILDKLNRF